MIRIFHAQDSRAVSRPLRGSHLLAVAAMLLPLQTQAWVSTPSKRVSSEVSTSAMPAESTVHVAVSLKLQDRAGLETLLKNLYTPGNPQFGHYLTPDQFKAAYAPSAAQAQLVVDYLKSMGMTDVTLSKGRMLVTAHATASVAEKAFNTKLVQFQNDGRTVHANARDLQVPDSLGGIVNTVLGLDNSVRPKTALQQQRDSLVFPPLTAKASAAVANALKLSAASVKAHDAGAAVTIIAFPPTAWDIAYDAGTSPDGSISTIAISTYGDTDESVVDDLRQMERQFGLPYVPVEIRTDPAGIASPDPSGDDEWDLDSQSSSAIAHNLKKLILYTGDGGTDDLVWQYTTFADMGDAQAGNMSYGTCELDAETGLLLAGPTTADPLFMQASAEGLSWHASTGDDGGVCSPINAAGASGAGIPLIANYPDSSPYVVAVGGTSLTTDADFNYSSETAWTSGGGGISVLEAPPSWQDGIVPSAAASAAGTGRGVPDISMDAGIYLPESAIASAADTIVGGTHYAVVGTSLSSPLAVGSWARLQSAHCNALGFAAPAYYALDTAGGLMSTATGFNDVTTGTNGDYVATTGWDYTTGFGSLDLSKVNAALPAAAAGCVASPTPPVAKLSAATTVAASTLTTTFDGSASSDPSGGSLTYYTLDYGDDTLPLQQTTPVFDAHTYTSPGVYTASLTVVNAAGAVSKAATQTITVTGMPLVCTIPGKLLVSSPAGSSGVPIPVPIAGSLLPVPPDPVPGQDLLGVSVAEPADMPGKLVFTMQVDTLSNLPPETRWAMFFTLPGDTTAYYVAMNSDGGTATFTYGQRGSLGGIKISVLGLVSLYNQLGTLDSTSNYTADGVITLVLDKSALNLVTGETIQALFGAVSVTVDPVPTELGLPTGAAVGENVDAANSRFGYTLIGNDACAAGVTAPGSGGSSSGGSSGGSLSGGGSTGTTVTKNGGASAFGLASLLPLLAGAMVRRRGGLRRVRILNR